MSKRVLVVDDQANVRSLLESLLVSWEASVTLMEDGESALRHLTELPNEYDLALLDLDFGAGKAHGLEVLQSIRQRHPDLPVIILTGQGTISTAVEAIQLGALDFVEKNFYIEEQLQQALVRLDQMIQEREARKAFRRDQRKRLERIERELKEAQVIQRSILPSEEPLFTGVDISSHFRPATEISGDYYDYIPLTETELGIAIGDAQGHGLPAGILVSTASSCLHTTLEMAQSVDRILEIMNRRIYGIKDRTFMTFCFSVLDTARRTITLSSAGHLLPYHYSTSVGAIIPWRTEGSFPLGVRQEMDYSVLSHSLDQGDVLVYYSDGLVEGVNQAHEHFGYERLEASITQHARESASSIRQAILMDFSDHCQQQELADDVTLMVIKIEKSKAHQS